jgi:hypothetical protein
MRILKTLLYLLLIPGLSLAQKEDPALMKTLNNYLDGGTNGNVEQFKSAFVRDAVQRSVGSKGEVVGMTVENLASRLTPGQTMDRQTRILSWSYSGIAATAVTETAYPTSKIIDYLNLLKIGNEWKIVTRVYSRIESDENVQSSSGAPAAAAKPATKTAAAPKATPAKKPVVADDGW